MSMTDKWGSYGRPGGGLSGPAQWMKPGGAGRGIAAAAALMLLGASAPASAYCTAEGSTSSYEWVDSLAINGASMTTGNNGGYYLHPEFSLDTPEISLDLTPGFSSFLYGENWGVWVDWNQDDAFDPSEQVFSGNTAADETLHASLAVPADALIGSTRMRIVMSYGIQPEPCGTFTYGEVEDLPLYVNSTVLEPPPPSTGDYCPASGLDASGEWIDAIGINGADFVTGSNGGYLTHSEVVALDGPTAEVTVTPGFGATSNEEMWAAWVDWNQDGVFDSAEQVFTGYTPPMPVTLGFVFDIPADAVPGETRMRIAMRPDAMPDACGEFPAGEVEDISVLIPEADAVPGYELTLGPDYTVYRSGALDAGVTWMVEQDGMIVDSVSGAYELSYRFGGLMEGSHMRIWLEQAGEPVSAPIEFVVGQTLNYQVSVDADYRLTRSGSLGEPLTWLVEENGSLVSMDDASAALDFSYPWNTPGLVYRVWLANNGMPVSNAVEYKVGGYLGYELTLDQSYRVVRTGNIGEPLLWRVVANGVLQGFYDASGDLQWINYDAIPGTFYEVTLTAADSFQTPVSNTVAYTLGDLPTTHTLTLEYTGLLTRSGSIGEPLMLVVEEEGRVIFEQDASYDLQFPTYMQPGLKYRFWLEAFVDGGYQRISNIVLSGTVEPQPEPLPTAYPYELSLGPDYTVYRNGALDADVTWMVEKDGGIVLSGVGAYSLSHRYPNLTEGGHFRVWLEEYIDGTYQQVSNAVEFTFGETLQYQLSVDAGYHLSRSGAIGDQLAWIIEQDGGIVLQRDASSELGYTYDFNVIGAGYRVWLARTLDGMRVSNMVEYKVGASLQYELGLDTSHRVVRTGNPGEPLLWRVEKDGMLQGFYDAASDLQWVDYERSEGSTYAITLVTDDSAQMPVSNTVQYTVDDLATLTHSITYADFALTRDGTVGGSNMYWVIEEEGHVVLEPYATNELQYYPTLTPGLRYRFWLKGVVGSAYQRISNIVTLQAQSAEPPVNPIYELSVGPDFTVYRNGPLDADVIWVLERDGEYLTMANGKYALSRRPWPMIDGSTFRVWLEEAGQVVAEPVEFTVGETLDYALSVDAAYHLSRSGGLVDPTTEPLTWVIEQDGNVVLERDASSEFVYTYFANASGSHYRVWLNQFINGTYRRVSNVVEYVVDGSLNYDLTLDLSHRVVRTGNLGEPLLWRVEKDAVLQGVYPAGDTMQWIDYEHSAGSTYAVTLVSDDAMQLPVSNTVQYTVDDIPLTHNISFADEVLTRSGVVGESVTWVIEIDGLTLLEGDASELEYVPALSQGQNFRFWLKDFVDGGYQRVSNIVIVNQ